VKLLGGEGKTIEVLLVEDSPGDVRLNSIKDFWLTRVKLPQRPDG